MNQETRITLAVALTFLMLILWRVFILKEPPTSPKTSSPSGAHTSLPQPSSPLGSGAASPSNISGTLGTAGPSGTPLPVREGAKAEEIVIESDLYQVTLSTRGAVVTSWVLKKYRDASEKPLDVVDHDACEKLGFPMSVNLADADLSHKMNSVLYVARIAERIGDDVSSVAHLHAPVNVDLVYSDGTTQVQKRFQFGRGYDAHVEVSVTDRQGSKAVEVAWPGGFGDNSLPADVREASTLAAYGTPDSINTVAQHKIKTDQFFHGPIALAGTEDRYFAGMFVPDSPDQAVFHIGRRDWIPLGWQGKEPLKVPLALLGSAQPKPLAFRLVVAPKDLDVLRSFSPPLDGLLDFGWFSMVAKPLFLILRYIYQHWVSNYGWAIMVLTVVINLAMFPLKLKSIRSAQKMQRVAPIVKEIQERYKQYKFNDPRKQRMQQEIMKVYQEHGINLLGGCLPMAMQIPFMYGFWRVLDLSIELRHAPWIGCVADLSMPDRCHPLGIPLAVLPTLMVASMFLLQKMTPMATPDPAQQRMMMFMPLIFGAMFYKLASGLVLYYLTANIVGIAQQLFINRVMPTSGGAIGTAAASSH